MSAVSFDGRREQRRTDTITSHAVGAAPLATVTPLAKAAPQDTIGGPGPDDRGATARAKRTVVDLLASVGITVNGDKPYDIKVNDPSFYTRVLRDPDLQLGLTYMDGLWDCAAIDQLTARLKEGKIRNKLVEPSTLSRTPVLLAQAAGNYTYRYLRDVFTNRQNRDRSTTVAKEHYDVGNELYRRMLDPTMTYTSGVFAPGYTLEDAQHTKYDLLCRKLGLKPGDRVLDIGCGFGGFARHAAKNYGCEVVGITISVEQLKAARSLSQDVPGTTFLYSDYRDLPNRFPKDHFDHVVSIEMIEAVGPKNLAEYFRCAQACLKDGGGFALQAIADNKDIVNCNAWFSEFIFQDGAAPSRNQVDKAAATHFGAPEDVHRITADYDKTLLEWHKRFSDGWPDLEAQYGPRFKRMWDFYLLGVAGGFRVNGLNLDQVVYRKGGSSSSAEPVREHPSRAQLDAWRATPSDEARTATRIQELDAHTANVKAMAAPKVREQKPLPLDARIGVIGAGPSGLSVADALRKRGYTNIVVMEAGSDVGGKSHTVEIDGRFHDLGATMGVPRKYDAVMELGAANGVKTTPFPKETEYDLSTGKPRPKAMPLDKAKFYVGTARYLAQNIRQGGLDGKRFEVPSEELADPWPVVARRNGYEAFGNKMDAYLTGYGYGDPAETPALYGYRMLDTSAVIGAGTGKLVMWENGTTPIWRKVAESLDVRTNTPVTHVDRSGEQVIVEAGGERLKLDRLVVAVDPAEAINFLDASAEEKDVFRHVKHMPYSTFACRVKGLSEGETSVGYVRENMRMDRMGHPMAWIKRYADDDVFVFHLFAPSGMTDDEVLTKIRDDVGKLGATDVQLVEARRWKFFPHVSGDAMRVEKFYERAANLQGEKNTVYANEVLSMSTMADVNAYAQKVAERVASSG